MAKPIFHRPPSGVCGIVGFAVELRMKLMEFSSDNIWGHTHIDEILYGREIL